MAYFQNLYGSTPSATPKSTQSGYFGDLKFTEPKKTTQIKTVSKPKPASKPVATSPQSVFSNIQKAVSDAVSRGSNARNKLSNKELSKNEGLGAPVGRFLQKAPDLNLGTKGQKTFKATDTETKIVNFMSNFPSIIARSYGKSLETLATPEGKKQLKQGGKDLPKTMTEVKTHIDKKEWGKALETAFANPAFSVGLDVADFIPVTLLAKFGIKAVTTGSKTLLQKTVKEGIEEAEETVIKKSETFISKAPKVAIDYASIKDKKGISVEDYVNKKSDKFRVEIQQNKPSTLQKDSYKQAIQNQEKIVDVIKRYDNEFGDNAPSVGVNNMDVDLYTDSKKLYELLYGAKRNPPRDISILIEELKDGLRAARSSAKQGIYTTPKYRLKDDFAKKGVEISDKQEADIISLNKNIFGDDNVKITGQVLTNSKAVGEYRDGMIKVLDGQADVKDTYYHEAVHKYLDVFTDKREYMDILLEGDKHYKLNDFSGIEERIAEDFIKYAKSRTGVTGGLKLQFDKVLLRIKKYFDNSSKIDELYNEILTKKADSSKVSVSRESVNQEDLNLVKEAIKSGDTQAAKAIYDDLPKGGYKPSFESLEQSVKRKGEIDTAKMENEGVQAVKEQYGQHTQVVQKMKNFLRISADKKDKDGLLYREHIPEKLFGVSSDEIATDLGMSENQFMQKIISELDVTKQEVPRGTKEVGVKRDLLPVGEGAEKASRLEARVTESLDKTPQEIKDQLGSTYTQMTKKDQIAQASQYVSENPSDALAVLRGEKNPPSGLLRNSIYVAMENQAKGNAELARKLASLSSTRAGQELSILTEIDPNSPVKAIRDIIEIREEAFKKRYGGRTAKEVSDKVVSDIQKKVKTPDKYDWNNFIKSLPTC